MASAKVVLLCAGGLGVVAAAGALWLLGGTAAPEGPKSDAAEESSARSDAPKTESGADAPAAGPAAAPAPATGGRILGRLVRGTPPVPVPGDVTVTLPGKGTRTAKAGDDGRF